MLNREAPQLSQHVYSNAVGDYLSKSKAGDPSLHTDHNAREAIPLTKTGIVLVDLISITQIVDTSPIEEVVHVATQEYVIGSTKREPGTW